MKYRLLFVAVFFGVVAYTMQPKFMSPDEVYATMPKITEASPVLQQAVQAWLERYAGGQAPYGTTVKQLIRFTGTRKAQVVDVGLNDVSQFNYVFMLPDGVGVVKIAGPPNIFAETISTLGQSPYDQRPMADILRDVGGQQAVFDAANSQDVRRFQATSALAYYRKIARVCNVGDLLKAPKTYAVHIPGQPEKFDDKNYIIVQEALGADIVPLSKLSLAEREQVLRTVPLPRLHEAVKCVGIWDLNADNVLVNRKNLKELWLADLEKPNNEGYGPRAKWKAAVFGKDDQSDDPWKWKRAPHAGHEEMDKLLAPYPERLQEWKALLANDAELQ